MRIALPLVSFPVDERRAFIEQFDGSDLDSNISCFRFWQPVFAVGCPFRCAYCCLQTIPSVGFRREALTGLLYRSWRRMLDAVQFWLPARTPRTLVGGELQDGPAFDGVYAKLSGKPLTHHPIPLFAAQKRHRLIFLTKSTLVRHALQLPPTAHVVFYWSVNAEYAARRWELGAPAPTARFEAARRMKEAGWPIRFRLDPMVPFHDGAEHWRDGYTQAIEHINALEPEMVTIGALRVTSKKALQQAAAKNGRPADLFNYLTEKDPSSFKYRLPFAVQVEMYRFALERLDRSRMTPALCKEDVSVWQALGLKFNGCHCLLSGPTLAAEIVSARGHDNLLPQGGLVAPRTGAGAHNLEMAARTKPTTLKLKPRPGTYAAVFSSLGEVVVQIGRLGKIRLRPGWYV